MTRRRVRGFVISHITPFIIYLGAIFQLVNDAHERHLRICIAQYGACICIHVHPGVEGGRSRGLVDLVAFPREYWADNSGGRAANTYRPPPPPPPPTLATSRRRCQFCKSYGEREGKYRVFQSEILFRKIRNVRKTISLSLIL